ncbi:hypothetical protein Fmac_025339 [Flemingia macrophylla]|uniref:Mediator complex subunit 15 KIX domain-containing protein n=1 Tax=Flemingia macrophylla TaxID=520843 RepID=A0ABD1LRY1_9FABA
MRHSKLRFSRSCALHGYAYTLSAYKRQMQSTFVCGIDANKMKPSEHQTNSETAGWKSSEYRKIIVKKCMNEIIKQSQWEDERSLPGILENLERFEERVNAASKTKSEYYHWLTEKIKAVSSQLKTDTGSAQDFTTVSNVPMSEVFPQFTECLRLSILVLEAGISENTEWKEHVYQKVQRMNRAYFAKLTGVYQLMNRKLQQLESSSQELNTVILENTRRNKKNIELVLELLRVNKSQITTEFKKRLDRAENFILLNFSPKNVSSPHEGQQHSAEVQSRQLFGPSHSSISQMEMLEAKPSPHASGTKNYHTMKDASQQNKMSLQEQQVAKQYSNSQQDVNQLSIKNGPGNAVRQQTQCTQKATEASCVSVNTRGISASPVSKNCNNVEEFSHKPTIIPDEPSAAMQGFVKVVGLKLTSISPESLRESVGDIRDLVYLCDQIPTSEFITGPPTMVQLQKQPSLIRKTGTNLASDMHPFSQARYVTCNDFAQSGRKRSRSMNAMTATSRICASSCGSFNLLTDAEKSDTTSVISKIKKPKIVETYSLLQEIKAINNLLIDSEIVIGEKDSIQGVARGAAKHGEGLVIKFIFNAVTVNQNLHLSSDKKSIIKPLWLLVPTSYPFSPPVILEMEVSEGLGDLSTIAKSILIYSLLNQPWTLVNIATSWERCAREAILEYAQALGGGTFSSIYGGWEMPESYL